MGRPVNKNNFGVVGPDNGNITVNCKIGSNSASKVGIILSQRSGNKFNIDDAAAGGGNTGICTLVDKSSDALGADEMSIDATVSGTSTQKTLKKIFSRTCTDFADVRYTWSISDDSTVNKMTIVAI